LSLIDVLCRKYIPRAIMVVAAYALSDHDGCSSLNRRIAPCCVAQFGAKRRRSLAVGGTIRGLHSVAFRQRVRMFCN
jgi:hypothetical protein